MNYIKTFLIKGRQEQGFNKNGINNGNITSALRVLVTPKLTNLSDTARPVIGPHKKAELLNKTAANARYNLHRQKTTGMKIPIAIATGTSIPLESWVAYGSVTRGSATRRRLFGSAEVSCSSSCSSSSASSDKWSSISSNGGSCGTSTVHSGKRRSTLLCK